MTIKANLDHSNTFGPPRNQGNRPTCLAFALSDLNRFYSVAPGILSAEYLYRSAARRTVNWKPDDGLYLSRGIEVTASPGQPLEEVLPYQVIEPTIPLEAMQTGDAMYSSRFHGMTTQANEVFNALMQGRPVGLVVKITQGFLEATKGIVPFAPMVFPGERHAVIATAAGIHKNTKDKYIRIRNSWGPHWGDGGYAWLHARYIDVHAVSAFGV